MNANETVRDVCAKYRDIVSEHATYVDYSHDDETRFLASVPDLILSAHEREIAAKDAEVERMIVANNAAIDTMQSRIDEMVEIVSAKDAEIAKHERCYHALEVHCKKLEEEYLRATNALKPVIECRIERIDGVDSPDGEFMTSSEYGVCDADGNEVDNHSIASSLNAVREAQRIYKEGEAK